MIVTAKGLTSGYLPLGAVLISEQVRDVILSPPGFVSGFTYTGHPTCCAVALANLDIIENEQLLGNARDVGDYLLDRFAELLELPSVGDVRGRGLMLGVELVTDKATKEPDTELGTLLGERMTSETGVIVRSIGNTLIFSPPLIFTRGDCDEVVEAVRQMIVKYASHAG
jgi:putrescine aminotransferase